MATGNDPNDLLLMLGQLAQLTQKIEQLNSEARREAVPLGDVDDDPELEAEAELETSESSTLSLAPGIMSSMTESPPRTMEELLEGLTERLEQFASQSEERARRMEARLGRIEKLLQEQAERKG